MALQDPNIMPSSRLDCPLSLKTPNMGNTSQELHINKDWDWTNDWTEYYRNRDLGIRPYLLGVITHEFGHTFGLAHSAYLYDVMTAGGPSNIERVLDASCDPMSTNSELRCGLSMNDKDAIRHLYPSSHSH